MEEPYQQARCCLPVSVNFGNMNTRACGRLMPPQVPMQEDVDVKLGAA